MPSRRTQKLFQYGDLKNYLPQCVLACIATDDLVWQPLIEPDICLKNKKRGDLAFGNERN